MNGVREGYKMTELGEIPEEWEVKTLGDITEITMGQSPASNTYNDLGKGIPFYQGKAEFGRKFPQVKKWCTQPTKIAQENDVLFSVRAPVGEVNMCQEESCIGRGLGSIRAINGKSFNWYLYFLLQYSKTKFSSLGQGSTFTAINGKELREFRIPTPPYKEQQNIAEILSTVDETIEKTNQLLEKTKELKKGLMQQLLTKGIGHTTFKQTELGEIPEGWEVKELESISKITRLAGAEYSDLWKTSDEGEIVALRGYNIGENSLKLEKIERITSELSQKLIRSKLFKGDIVFPCVGTIGKATLIVDDNKYHINQNIAKISPSNSIDPLYLVYCLMSPYIKMQILKYNTSSSQPNILVGNLRKFRIIVPTLTEQQKIADILSSVDDSIVSFENEKKRYQKMKKGLMQQLLTGKKRVNI
ncbi:restriction endonuclease subunit S [Rossellomorea marisflavi]|uniref:restriction endonuclease subunit S n=1 Tax=Rossellomorea marisflavi TaxID=189381 RepID=UPI003459D384